MKAVIYREHHRRALTVPADSYYTSFQMFFSAFFFSQLEIATTMFTEFSLVQCEL